MDEDNDPDDAQREEDLTLRLWDGDESALGELLLLYGARLEATIARRFPGLGYHDVEDVIAEAVSRFWQWKDKYDPTRAKVGTVLYKIAARVAAGRCACRQKWEKQRAAERELSDVVAEALKVYDRTVDEELAEPEPPSALCKAIGEILVCLPPLDQDILRAYAGALGEELDAGWLGIELGRKHNDGVPIPAGRIRVYKSRARQRIITELRHRGFDLKTLGYLDE